MKTLYESYLKGPETIMTLTSDHDYPKILKDMMKHIHLEGDESTKATHLWKMEWNFGTWKYTSSVKKEFLQRLLGNTFSFPEYLEPPSSTLFVKLLWKPYVRLEKY